jgi:predicted TIM-barrel fold metal-dependent hydrolase
MVPPPPGACDTHAHVFGPASRFAYADDRSYTPPDAPLEKYLAMLDTVGFSRGALVQGSAHGRDNAAMLDALAREPQRLRGVAVADGDVSPAELKRWHALGVRGLRFNHFFRGGALHYRGGVPLEAAKALAPVMAELGWHVQLWIDVKDLADTMPLIKAIGRPIVVDHMGRSDAVNGTGTPGFQSLLRLLGDGGCWVKVSGAHRIRAWKTRCPMPGTCSSCSMSGSPTKRRAGASSSTIRHGSTTFRGECAVSADRRVGKAKRAHV